MWCVGKLTDEYRRRMYTLLDLYAQPMPAGELLICGKARRIHLVLDNLNTHFRVVFEQILGKRRATELLRRVRFHHTPTHASWLNMAEIEIAALDRQCLDRRLPDEATLISEVKAWEKVSECPAAHHRVDVHSPRCRPKDGQALCLFFNVLTY